MLRSIRDTDCGLHSKSESESPKAAFEWRCKGCSATSITESEKELVLIVREYNLNSIQKLQSESFWSKASIMSLYNIHMIFLEIWSAHQNSLYLTDSDWPQILNQFNNVLILRISNHSWWFPELRAAAEMSMLCEYISSLWIYLFLIKRTNQLWIKQSPDRLANWNCKMTTKWFVLL